MLPCIHQETSLARVARNQPPTNTDSNVPRLPFAAAAHTMIAKMHLRTDTAFSSFIHHHVVLLRSLPALLATIL